MTRRAARAAVLLLAVLVGCTDDADGTKQPVPAPDVELGFTQLLPDEGSRRALLRVENLGEGPLEVTAAGLRWSGYGDFAVPQDAVLTAGQTLDLRVRLPRPDCSQDGDDPVVGVVRTGGAEVVQELSGSGQVFVRRLWAAWCTQRLVDRTVEIAYAPGWRIAPGPGDEPAARGFLRLTRLRGAAPVSVLGSDGSVLHDFAVPAGRLGPGEARARLAAAVLPGNRCDEHARGQATAPFSFAVVLRIGRGDGVRARVLVPPPVPVQRVATRALDLACAQRTR